jgi:hypothetical protein
MTEDELRDAMRAYENELPSDKKLEEWAKAIGKDVAEVKKIYGEVIGDPDPWGRPIGGMG